jgi:hypothetical protein
MGITGRIGEGLYKMRPGRRGMPNVKNPLRHLPRPGFNTILGLIFVLIYVALGLVMHYVREAKIVNEYVPAINENLITATNRMQAILAVIPIGVLFFKMVSDLAPYVTSLADVSSSKGLSLNMFFQTIVFVLCCFSFGLSITGTNSQYIIVERSKQESSWHFALSADVALLTLFVFMYVGRYYLARCYKPDGLSIMLVIISFFYIAAILVHMCMVSICLHNFYLEDV